MKREELYEPPQMEILELHTEGLLCASGDGIDAPGLNKGGNLDDLFN